MSHTCEVKESEGELGRWSSRWQPAGRTSSEAPLAYLPSAHRTKTLTSPALAQAGKLEPRLGSVRYRPGRKEVRADAIVVSSSAMARTQPPPPRACGARALGMTLDLVRMRED